MKLTLNKKAVKSLSKDKQALPSELTPHVGGAAPQPTASPIVCVSHPVCWTVNYLKRNLL
ncbi:hypothetical protein CWB72_16485 [Pseudoalteromonas phenolica]|uniref:hypothetical protein n=1 Tax=Pseudoalteromonas phenolica TaxID=161398 RepID=UPI00110AAD1F|nr:hypothetical protein [Pseudoalteromonas phenolica]TMN87213.1 hypothetical protein CWB72_16485 [Pseudoalteromonas phenolica]